MSRHKKEFLPPLFERLALDGGEMLDEDGMRVSVAEELALIFNTRSVTKRDEDAGPYAETFPPFFGFVDNTRSLFDNEVALKKRIQETIERYEPRLEAPEVVDLFYDQDHCAYQVVLKGQLVLGDRRVPATFPIKILDAS
jgi:predicted component of type VI protein secretion system